MRQHSGALERKWNRQLTRPIFPAGAKNAVWKRDYCQAAMPHSSLVPTPRKGCGHETSHTHVRHVNSAVHSGDSYKTKNADDGKAKSRDTRVTNCKAGTRERPANLFILALPCRCRHASLGFTYISFSRRLLHTNLFSHFPT